MTAFYLTGEGSAVCVLGPNPGALVPAQTDTDALLVCANSTLGVPLTQSVSGQTLPLAASPDPLVLVSASGLDERINPALASGTLVRNYRNGVTVDDWESGGLVRSPLSSRLIRKLIIATRVRKPLRRSRGPARRCQVPLPVWPRRQSGLPVGVRCQSLEVTLEMT